MSLDPNRVEEIWLKVFALSEPVRSRRLEAECGGNAQLRRRVEELLQASTRASAENFLENDAETEFLASSVQGSFGRYVLRGLIGEGGMGEVYEAWDPEMQRVVAIKTLPANIVHQKSAKDRIRREIALLARINHPNVVAAHDASLEADRPFLVMEHVVGKTFEDLVAETGPLTPEKALPLVAQAARGLAACHALGVLHRDVKPRNLLWTTANGAEPAVKVIDLGVAGLIDQEEAARLTDEGTGVGTADYAAPEQIHGEASPQSDVYGLGGVLYFLLTGKSPYNEIPTAAGRLAAHLSAPPPKLSHFPQPVAALVESMLAKDPNVRPRGMDGVLEKLASVENSLKKSEKKTAWWAISAFLLMLAWFLASRRNAMRPWFEETREICLTLTSAIGLIGAVFAMIRSMRASRLLNVGVGTSLAICLTAAAVYFSTEMLDNTTSSPRLQTDHRQVSERHVSPGQTWEKMADFLRTTPSLDLPNVRFLTRGPLNNRSDITKAALVDLDKAILAWARDAMEAGGAGDVRVIRINDTLYAVILNEAKFDPIAWDRVVSQCGTAMRLSENCDSVARKHVQAVYDATQAEVPLVSATDFLAACHRKGLWREEYDRPLRLADLAAELGLDHVNDLADWLRAHPVETDQWNLAPLLKGERIGRDVLRHRISGRSAYQLLPKELKLGQPVIITVAAP